MARHLPPSAPPKAATTTVRHVVSFYETDAMGIVHHSNYVRFFEHARVQYLIDHDRPYTAYMGEGLHMPVTRVEAVYMRPCRFADAIDVTCWVSWVRAASLGFHYRLSVQGELVAHGSSDHAIIDETGRPQRLPEALRERLRAMLSSDAD
jgi:acyl-CoA thioester hydrolase